MEKSIGWCACCPCPKSTKLCMLAVLGKYLTILEAPFAKLHSGSLRELCIAVPGLVKTLAMVWSSSKSYNVPARMVSVLLYFSLFLRLDGNYCLCWCKVTAECLRFGHIEKIFVFVTSACARRTGVASQAFECMHNTLSHSSKT